MTEENKNSYKSRVDDIMNQTLVGMNLAMAYEVGIIQALTHSDVAMTSQEVADAKNLKERYVRELLNSLACAHVVEVERLEGVLRYHIAKENRAVFDPAMTPFLQLLASSAVRFQGLRDCITKDGPYGLPYGDFPMTLHATQRISEAKLETEIKLTLDILPGIQAKLEAGITVIELGSGSAFFISEMARRFPNSTFIGSDYCPKTLEAARKSVAPLKLQNLNLIQIDIFDIPAEHTAKYDLAMVNDVIHDLPDSQAGLRGIRQVLKPGGYLAMYEVGAERDVMVAKELPGMAVPYAVSAFHCVPEAYHNETSKPLGCCWGKDTAIQYSERAGLKLTSRKRNFWGLNLGSEIPHFVKEGRDTKSESASMTLFSFTPIWPLKTSVCDEKPCFKTQEVKTEYQAHFRNRNSTDEQFKEREREREKAARGKWDDERKERHRQ